MSTIQRINNPSHVSILLRLNLTYSKAISWGQAAISSEERLRVLQNISSSLQQGDTSFASKEVRLYFKKFWQS